MYFYFLLPLYMFLHSSHKDRVKLMNTIATSTHRHARTSFRALIFQRQKNGFHLPDFLFHQPQIERLYLSQLNEEWHQDSVNEVESSPKNKIKVYEY